MRRVLIVLASIWLIPPLLSAQKHTPLRIAVVADTHLSPSRAEAETALRSVLEEIKLMGDEVDLLIHAGDITEYGDSLSLQKNFDLLSEVGIPFLVVPGNHETKWSESLATDFAKIYGYDRFSYDLGNFRIIGVNTGPIIRMMDGHLYPIDLYFIRDELEKMPDGMQAILVTHYPLQSKDVDNWYAGTSLLREYPIALVIGGHYHNNYKHFYDGVPGFLLRSTLPDKEGQAGFTIIELTETQAEAHEYQVPHRTIIKWATHHLGLDQSQPIEPLPDYTLNEVAKEHVEELWQASSAEAFMTAPAVAKDYVIAVNDGGRVCVYQAHDGTPIWSQETGARVVGAPQANDSVVAVGNAAGQLFAFSLSDGTPLWQRQLGEPLSGAIAFYGDTLYVGDRRGTMHAIRLHDGAPIWHAPVGKDYIETRPYVDEEWIIFGAWDEHLYALDRETGVLKWQWRGPKAGMHFSPAAVWPVVHDGAVFVTAPDRVLSAIDLESGETLKRHTDDSVRETIAISDDATRLYSKTMQDQVIALSPNADLQLLWRCDVGYGYDHAASMPIEVGETVVVVTKNGLIGGIDAKSGTKLWLYKIGNTLINTPVKIDPTTFAYTTMDGIVGVLRLKK